MIWNRQNGFQGGSASKFPRLRDKLMLDSTALRTGRVMVWCSATPLPPLQQHSSSLFGGKTTSSSVIPSTEIDTVMPGIQPASEATWMEKPPMALTASDCLLLAKRHHPCHGLKLEEEMEWSCLIFWCEEVK